MGGITKDECTHHLNFTSRLCCTSLYWVLFPDKGVGWLEGLRQAEQQLGVGAVVVGPVCHQHPQGSDLVKMVLEVGNAAAIEQNNCLYR